MPVNNGITSVVAQDESVKRSDFSRSILFVGIKQTAGTAVTQTLKENITSKAKVNEYFGRTSHIAQGLNFALSLSENRTLDHKLLLSGIGIDSIGTLATGSIEFSGTATSSSNIVIQYGKHYEKTYSVSKTATSASIASGIVALINSDLDSFLVASVDGSNSSLVNLTASVKGTWANNFKIRVENLPSGITKTITEMSGGNYTGLSSLSTLVSSIQKKQFDIIVIEKDIFSIDSALETEMSNRYDIVQNQFLSGFVMFSSVGSELSDFTNILETKKWGIDNAIMYENSYTLPYIYTAFCALIKEIRLVQNANCVNLINTPNGIGEIQNLKQVINDIDVSSVVNVKDLLLNQFSSDDLIALKEKGFLTTEVNDQGTLPILTGNQTTYILDNNGDVPSLNRINDVEKQIAISSDVLDLINTYRNKTVSLVDKVGLTNIISLNDAIKDFEQLVNKWNYKDENGVFYGILDDSKLETILTNIKTVVTTAFETYENRTLNINALYIAINKAIENIITVIKFS